MPSPFTPRSHPNPSQSPAAGSSSGALPPGRETSPTEKAQLPIRERIFNFVTQFMSALALPPVVIFTAIVLRRGDIAHAVAYVAVYVLLLLTAFTRRRFPLNVRVWGLLVIVWAASMAAYTTAGVRGDGRVWIMGGVVVAALLLDGWQMVLGVALTVGVHALAGWIYVHQWLPMPPDETRVLSALPQAWINTGLTLVAISILISSIVFALRRNLEGTLDESQQLTVILERERQRLERQGRALQRRLAQLRTASEISRVAATLLDEQELMEKVISLIQERFDLYYVGVFLLDERGEYAVLKAGTGEAGQKMLQAGHRLAVGGTSMIGWSIANRQPRIALDVGEDAVRFDNPYLPLTRSELALPLIARGEVLGAMTIQSERPEAFDQDDLMVLQGIADALANALANARLFRTTQEALQELEALHTQFMMGAWSDFPAEGWQIVSSATEDGDGASTSADTRHLLRLPLRLRQTTIGEVVLEREEPWTAEDEALAQAMLTQASLALENASLVIESLRRANQEQVLSQMSARVGATLDLDQMLRIALRELQQALDLREAEIQLLTPSGLLQEDPS